MSGEMGYLQWHADAERRTKLGQKQYQCRCHGLWLWWDERKGHKLTERGE